MATGDEQRPVDGAEPPGEGDGRLPVTEVTFSMAGAASPFGDDVEFPLPADRVQYEPPSAP